MTLTETAQLTKKVFIIGSIVLVVIIILWVGITYYINSRPVEVYVEQPTKTFGILPKTPLPKTKLTANNVSYNLDTETGSLPQGFPALIKVYFIPKLGTTFLAPDKAKKLAASFSFRNGPQILSPTLYKFSDDNGGEFIFDLDTANFRFKRTIVATPSGEFQQQQEDKPLVQIEGENLLISNFKKYLSERGVLPEELSSGQARVFYNKPKPNDSTEAAVTIWESDIKEGEEETSPKYPIVSPEFKEGLIRGVVTKYQTNENKYLSIDYIYWPIDLQNSSTYPTITVEQAFEKLKNGEGVTVLPYSQSTVAIEKVYLAYLLPKEYTPYLQPVYVFEGPSFAAYVPAITSDNFEP